VNKKKSKPKKKLEKPLKKIAWIRWKDHTATAHAWTPHEEITKGVLICETVGFVLDEDNEVLRLALSGDSQGNYSNVMKIIKSCIVKRKIMK